MFTTNDTPVSKILVLDNSLEHAGIIKRFCEQNHLVPLRARGSSVMSVLASNIDLGGIFYAEDYCASVAQTTEIAGKIHAMRPELPIIIRRESNPTLEDLPEELRRACCAAYVASDIDAVHEVIDKYIFCLIYPNALLRGLTEIMQSVLAEQCRNLEVSVDTPYIVRDRVIFGELFSLIQLESAWCRGYMMLQSEHAPFVELLENGTGAAVTFRQVNDLLSEITNLMWGAFKNRYIGGAAAATATQVQVPLVINHKHKYISFGSSNPQLCFRFTLRDASTGKSTLLYVRFVFNLSWSPDDFAEIPRAVSGLVDSGELELF